MSRISTRAPARKKSPVRSKKAELPHPLIQGSALAPEPPVPPSSPEATAAPAPRPSDERPLVIRWHNPIDIESWLAALEHQIKNLTAAGRDATLPIRECVYARCEARRRIRTADRTLSQLLEAGTRSLAEAKERRLL